MYEVDQYTVSLLHFEDGLKDETGKVWAFYGGAVIDTSQKKDGVSSLKLDKSKGSYILVPNISDLNFKDGEFTIDFNIMFNSLPQNEEISFVSQRLNPTSNHSFTLGYYGANLCAAFNNNTISHSISWVPKLNTWYHLAMVRFGEKIMYFIDGILMKSFDFTATLISSNADLAIGSACYNGYTNYFLDGYIDEFRISNVARWTSDFDPETPQVPSGQGLLRITMNDSSEREYRLSSTDIEKFIKWYDRTVGTGNTCYVFDDIVDLSKEYLSFEKIISFKVIPLKD